MHVLLSLVFLPILCVYNRHYYFLLVMETFVCMCTLVTSITYFEMNTFVCQCVHQCH